MVTTIIMGNHAGGLLWPKIIGQRDRREEPSPPATDASGFFNAQRKIQTTTGTKMSQDIKLDTKIDFDKMDGLVPGIVQDAKTGQVLMLGFLNPASYAKTQETGFVTFWSRTRQKLWMKGETSGNRLRVISAATDCDNDTLLFRVEVEGDGLVCHEGTVSCFTRPVTFRSEVTRG
jgi:phosphoribosyl-AMP cyclohydrolase